MGNKDAIPGFTDLKAGFRHYVSISLELTIMAPSCPPRIKLSSHFVEFLVGLKVDRAQAIDTATYQKRLLLDEVDRHIGRWRAQGVTPPFDRSTDDEEDDSLITWAHSGYERHTGEAPLGPEFFKIYHWLGSLKEKEFHLPCLCYLSVLKCDPIFLTDGARDEGIDYIGLISSGPMRSTAVFVQAKSGVGAFGSADVQQESAKYQGMVRTDMYMHYLNALGVPSSTAGAAFVYAIISNGDIKHGAASSSYRVGALLRSRRQLALTLSTEYTFDDLVRLATSVTLPAHPDLSRNLASLLNSDSVRRLRISSI